MLYARQLLLTAVDGGRSRGDRRFPSKNAVS
jgi:hypothetical protein